MEQRIKPRLSEERHHGIAESLLRVIRYFKQEGDGKKVRDNVERLVDNIGIARCCGYEGVAEKYSGILKDECFLEYLKKGD